MSDILPYSIWQEARQHHQRGLLPILEPHLNRASHNEKHPVLDFLFRYYSFRPNQLLRWTPGWGVFLERGSTRDFPPSLGFVSSPRGCALAIEQFPKKRVPFLQWVLHLNQQLLIRQPRFSCFGLHEWAMLYRSGEPRHEAVPLRVSPSTIGRTVESLALTCTHFDAFRFFSPEAIPLNATPLTRDSSIMHEQPGCLHASMDLYKCCYKLYPWISSDLLRDSFFLAQRARIIDMEASPYDIRGLGYRAIPIETEEGKALYIENQRMIHDEAQRIRRRLVRALQILEQAASAHTLGNFEPCVHEKSLSD